MAAVRRVLTLLTACLFVVAGMAVPRAAATDLVATVLTVTGPDSVRRGTHPTFTLTLTRADTGVALEGARVTLALGDRVPVANLTDSTGTVRLVLGTRVDAGDWLVEAAFAGDATYAPATTQRTLTVLPEQPRLKLRLPTAMKAGAQYTFVGELVTSEHTGQGPVLLDLVDVSGAVVQRVTSSLTEYYRSFVFSFVLAVPAGSYTAHVHYDGDRNHEPVAQSTPVEVTRQRLSGPVWIPTWSYDDYYGEVEVSAWPELPGTSSDGIVVTTEVTDESGTVVRATSVPVTEDYARSRIAVRDLPPGYYTATVTTDGTDVFEPLHVVRRVLKWADRAVVTLVSPHKPYAGEPTELVLRMTSHRFGTPLADRPLTVKTTNTTATSVVTDANGEVRVSWTPPHATSASVYTDVPSDPVVEGGWQSVPLPLRPARAPVTVAVPEAAAVRGDTVTLRARVTSGNWTVYRGTATFTVAGHEPVSAPVDHFGWATAPVSTAGIAAGVHEVSVSYSGDSDFLPGTGTGTLSVSRPTELTWLGDVTGRAGDTVVLRARLTDPLDGSPIAGATVRFTVGTAGATVVTVVTAVTDAAGVAAATHQAGTSVRDYAVRVEFAGSALALPSSTSGLLRVVWPYRFAGADPSTYVLLNPLTWQLMLVTPTWTSPVLWWHSPVGRQVGDHVVNISLQQQDVTFAGWFNLTTGQFSATWTVTDEGTWSAGRA